MSAPDQFVARFVAHLRDKAGEMREWGAGEVAQACERVAEELENQFRGWWLAELTVSEAAEESGYSEERLREMAREGSLPNRKGEGERGHIMISRCELPRKPRPPQNSSVASIEERLLRKGRPSPLRTRH